MSTTDLPKPEPCPACGAMVECATGVDGDDLARPKPGSWNICFHCAAITRFREDLTQRLVDEDELGREATAEQLIQLRRIQAGIQFLNTLPPAGNA